MLENISGSSLKEEFKSNNKLRLITYSIGGAVVLVLGYFLYKQLLTIIFRLFN